MKVSLAQVSRDELQRLISSSDHVQLSDNETWNKCMAQTAEFWVGKIDEVLISVWGVTPPTLLSDRAYLWLYATNKVAEHEFIFIRHSQQAIEKLLATYPLIVGHCLVNADRSQRWLRWLGAEFGFPEGNLVPFEIRGQCG